MSDLFILHVLSCDDALFLGTCLCVRYAHHLSNEREEKKKRKAEPEREHGVVGLPPAPAASVPLKRRVPRVPYWHNDNCLTTHLSFRLTQGTSRNRNSPPRLPTSEAAGVCKLRDGWSGLVPSGVQPDLSVGPGVPQRGSRPAWSTPQGAPGSSPIPNLAICGSLARPPGFQPRERNRPSSKRGGGCCSSNAKEGGRP